MGIIVAIFVLMELSYFTSIAQANTHRHISAKEAETNLQHYRWSSKWYKSRETASRRHAETA